MLDKSYDRVLKNDVTTSARPVARETKRAIAFPKTSQKLECIYDTNTNKTRLPGFMSSPLHN
jgi:hypothetical protein